MAKQENADDKVISEALARAQFCIEFEADSRQAMKEDIRFAAGEQWPEWAKKERELSKRPMLTFNKTNKYVRQITNDARQNRPGIKVAGVDDRADPKLAEALSGVVRYIERNSNADYAYDQACEHQVQAGLGWIRVITDYAHAESFEQDIFIRRVKNPYSCYIDPYAQEPDGSDARYGFVFEELDKDVFKAEYPDVDVHSFAELPADVQRHWCKGDSVMVAEYFVIRETPIKLALLATGEVVPEDAAPQGVQIISRRPSRRKVCEWYKLCATKVLEQSEFPAPYIPIIPVLGEEYLLESTVQRNGIIRQLKDAQRMYNFWATTETERLAMSPKAPFVGAAEQFEDYEDIWATANSANHAYLPYKAVATGGGYLPAPQRVNPLTPTQDLMNARMAMTQDIKEIVGIYDAALGAQSNETSGKAILARQRESDNATFHYIDNLNRAIRHVGRIVVALIPKIYDTRRVVRILGEDGAETEAVFDPNMQQPAVIEQDGDGNVIREIYNPTIGRYDIAVSSGTNYATKREQFVEAAMQLAQSAPQLWAACGDLIVKHMDWPGAEEMAERLAKMVPPQVTGNAPPPEMQELQAQFQQLQQAYQELEQSYEAKKLEIEAYNAETNRMKVLQPAAEIMTPEAVQMLVVQTIQSMMQDGPMQQESEPEIVQQQEEIPPELLLQLMAEQEDAQPIQEDMPTADMPDDMPPQ
jgi:hypothetical protein